jgi:hypothetical protein
MGLDAVELVMAVEYAFDVRIEDDEAVRMNTPGDVIEVVWRKVEHADSTTCLTQRSFNLLRASLMRRLPFKRSDIRPGARMAALVPRDRRAALLDELATDLNTGPLPALERPAWVVRLCAVASLALGIYAGLRLYQSSGAARSGLAIAAAVAVAVLAQTIAWQATSPLRRCFPPLIATVGDLSRWIMLHKTDFVGAAAHKRWTREQVSARVREVVIEELDCAAAYSEDARFIEDLGMG